MEDCMKQCAQNDTQYKILSRLLLSVALLLLTGCCGLMQPIDADDVGIGKTIHLPTRPEKNDLFVASDNNEHSAVAKWRDTGLYLMGSVIDSDGKATGVGISLNIGGKWYPWGKVGGVDKSCAMVQCSESNDDGCALIADEDAAVVVANTYSNIGCYLSNGYGIYILISANNNDPNNSVSEAISPPSDKGFYTAHIGDFSAGNTIYIDKFYSCAKKSTEYHCEPFNINDLIGGKIYLKVLDRHYNDNESERSDNIITVKFKEGIYQPGFITAALTALNDTTKNISKILREKFTEYFSNIMRAVVFLYFTFTAFGFLIGMIKITQTEAIVRLLKIGIVIMFVTPSYTTFIQDNFLDFYRALGNYLANKVSAIISGTQIAIKGETTKSDFGDLGYLIQYDNMINSITSPVIHIKIFALLFTTKFFFIPLLYVLIVIIVVIILRAIILYVVAYLQIALLEAILPIFGMLLLFNVTSSIFQNWLRAIASTTIMLVVATLGIGLTLHLMYAMLSDLMYYSVSCKNFFLFLGWVIPDDMNIVQEHLNASKYFSALFIAIVFYKFMAEIQKLADSLSDSQLSPTANAFNATWGGVNRLFGQGVSSFKKFNQQYGVGRLLDQRYKRDGQYVEDKEGNRILDKWKTLRLRVNYLIDNKYTRLINPNTSMNSAHDISAKLDIAQSAGYDPETLIQRYTDMVEQKRVTLIDQLSEANLRGNAVNQEYINKAIDKIDSIDVQLSDVRQQQLDSAKLHQKYMHLIEQKRTELNNQLNAAGGNHQELQNRLAALDNTTNQLTRRR